MTVDAPAPGAAPAFSRIEKLAAVGVVGLLALALGVVALLTPASTSRSAQLHFAQSGHFGYSAHVPTGSVYGPEGLRSGDPVLTDVAGPVTARFAYRFRSAARSDVHGTIGMVARVALPEGLTRELPVAATRSFRGGRAVATGRLPLGRIRSLAAAASAGTSTDGIETSGISITLVPRVVLAGTIGPRSVRTTYAPQLAFSLAGKVLTPGGGQGVTTQSSPVALDRHKAGSIGYRTDVPNRMSLLVARPTVPVAREVGLGGAALCLLLCLWLSRAFFGSRDAAGEAARIRTLYGSLLVPVHGLSERTGPVAEVASFEALADVAKRYESVIMHLPGDDGDEYLVWDSGFTYRYRQHQPAAADPAATSAPGADDVKAVVETVPGKTAAAKAAPAPALPRRPAPVPVKGRSKTLNGAGRR